MATTAETNEVRPDVSPALEPTGEITEAQLIDMLHEMDGLKPPSRSASPEPAPKDEAKADTDPLPADGKPSAVESEQKQEADQPSPVAKETEAKETGDNPQKGEAAEPAKEQVADTKEAKIEGRLAKDQARLAESWKKLEDEKAAVRKQAEELKLAKEKAEEEAIKSVAPDMSSSPEDLRRYARDWEQEGKDEVAAEARRMADQIEKAQKLKAERDERLTKEQNEIRATNARRLLEDNPDLKNQDSPLYKALTEIVNNQDAELKDFFARSPHGLVYGTQIAKMKIAAESAASLQEEIATIKKENEELKKKLSLGSSTGSKPVKAKKDFEEMDYKEQEAFLKKMLSESDSVLAGV